MRIVGLGGTVRAGSATERALRLALRTAEQLGATTTLLTGPQIALPFYDPSTPDRTCEAAELVAELRSADGIILASPGYHSLITGLVKNALDYIEDLARDERPYLDGIAVGCIGLGMGFQGAVAAMHALRAVTHSLRGWPTPYGCSLCIRPGLFDGDRCTDPQIESQLCLVGEQVTRFARMKAVQIAAADSGEASGSACAATV